MGAADPERAVLEDLAGPVGVWEPGGPSPGGVESGIVRGGRLEQADMATVRFVKHRQSAMRHLYFVSFEGTIPQLGADVHRFGYVYPVEPDPTGGWRVFGGVGGSGEPPRRSRPWVNLGGGGWPDRFYAGGQIEDDGLGVDRIELRFANGVVLRDDATHGVVLFITDETVAMPATLVMLDRAGTEIATHRPFPEI
ncbi:MAG: hypothetical protein JO304_22945 [Solirubrobacterales bacterium]|nr:hypothetical protein [Solirubrobacterales bacterium]